MLQGLLGFLELLLLPLALLFQSPNHVARFLNAEADGSGKSPAPLAEIRVSARVHNDVAVVAESGCRFSPVRLVMRAILEGEARAVVGSLVPVELTIQLLPAEVILRGENLRSGGKEQFHLLAGLHTIDLVETFSLDDVPPEGIREHLVHGLDKPVEIDTGEVVAYAVAALEADLGLILVRDHEIHIRLIPAKANADGVALAQNYLAGLDKTQECVKVHDLAADLSQDCGRFSDYSHPLRSGVLSTKSLCIAGPKTGVAWKDLPSELLSARKATLPLTHSGLYRSPMAYSHILMDTHTARQQGSFKSCYFCIMQNDKFGIIFFKVFLNETV